MNPNAPNAWLIQCEACGYDLTGIAGTANSCPECGRDMPTISRASTTRPGRKNIDILRCLLLCTAGAQCGQVASIFFVWPKTAGQLNSFQAFVIIGVGLVCCAVVAVSAITIARIVARTEPTRDQRVIYYNTAFVACIGITLEIACAIWAKVVLRNGIAQSDVLYAILDTATMTSLLIAVSASAYLVRDVLCRVRRHNHAFLLRYGASMHKHGAIFVLCTMWLMFGGCAVGQMFLIILPLCVFVFAMMCIAAYIELSRTRMRFE